MLRHQENLYKTINMIYHGKYTPYPMLSYGPYDCPLCPVKGLYHEMRSIVIACRGDIMFIVGRSYLYLGHRLRTLGHLLSAKSHCKICVQSISSSFHGVSPS